MSYEDEFGKQYEFESLYRAYSNLGEPESIALDKVLEDAGITTGFYGLCERARMLCYEIDSEYWDAHKPEWAKATKKSISKPAPKFNDMVQKQRSKNSAVVKNDDEYPPYISDYKELKNGIFNYLNRYDSAEYLQLIFSLLADDSHEYEQLWEEWELHWF